MIERERIEMFLDNLSASLLQICAAEKLSYEKAAEKCGCCSRHISNIMCWLSGNAQSAFRCHIERSLLSLVYAGYRGTYGLLRRWRGNLPRLPAVWAEYRAGLSSLL